MTSSATGAARYQAQRATPPDPCVQAGKSVLAALREAAEDLEHMFFPIECLAGTGPCIRDRQSSVLVQEPRERKDSDLTVLHFASGQRKVSDASTDMDDDREFGRAVHKEGKSLVVGSGSLAAPGVPSRLEPAERVGLPLPRAGATAALSHLLAAGLRPSRVEADMARAVDAGQWIAVVDMLNDGSPQQLFAKVMARLAASSETAGSSLGGLDRFVADANWAPDQPATSSLTYAQCEPMKAALVMGTTFPHAAGSLIQCQDGIYLSRFGTVVVDGMGGHSASEYDCVRAQQVAVGTIAAAISDQLGQSPRPDAFLKAHYKTLVQLLNAAAFAAKPPVPYGEPGVAFTCVLDLGRRGLFGFGVGDAGAAAGGNADSKGSLQLFIPEMAGKKGQSREAGVARGVVNDADIQLFEFDKRARRIFVMSDGPRGLLEFGGSGKRSADAKTRAPAESKRLVTAAQLLSKGVDHAVAEVGQALDEAAKQMGHMSSDGLTAAFRKRGATENALYLALLNLAKRTPEADGKRALPRVEDEPEAGGMRRMAGDLAIRFHARTVIDLSSKVPAAEKTLKERVAAALPDAEASAVWRQLDALVAEAGGNSAHITWDSVLTRLGYPPFDQLKRNPPELAQAKRIVNQDLIDHLGHRVNLAFARSSIEEIARVADISSNEVNALMDAVKAELMQRGMEARLVGRDDVSFAARDRVVS